MSDLFESAYCYFNEDNYLVIILRCQSDEVSINTYFQSFNFKFDNPNSKNLPVIELSSLSEKLNDSSKTYHAIYLIKSYNNINKTSIIDSQENKRELNVIENNLIKRKSEHNLFIFNSFEHLDNIGNSNQEKDNQIIEIDFLNYEDKESIFEENLDVI